MTTPPLDAQGEARQALSIIVADPRYGPAALSNPQTMTNLLKDILPDTPREASVLVAASEAGVPGMLQSNVAQGMDWDTASRLAAASLENRTALTPEACTWAVSVLGSALHLDAAAARPQPETVKAPEARPDVTPRPEVSPGPPNRLRIGGAAAAAAAAILIIWACALTLFYYHSSGSRTLHFAPVSYAESLFSLSGGSPSTWGHAIPWVVVAVLGVAAAVLLLVAHTEWLRWLAAGLLLAFGIASALVWVSYEFLYRTSFKYGDFSGYEHPGPGVIVGILGGLLLLAAGALALVGRETHAGLHRV